MNYYTNEALHSDLRLLESERAAEGPLTYELNFG